MALYPENIIAEICSSTNGICTKQKYLPSLFELKAAFEELAEIDRSRIAILRRRQEQLDERDMREREIEQSRANGTRPTYEELMAKVPQSLKITNKINSDKMSEGDFLKKFPHITKEMLDAVPNANGPQTLFAKPLSTKPEEPNPFEAPE